MPPPRGACVGQGGSRVVITAAIIRTSNPSVGRAQHGPPEGREGVGLVCGKRESFAYVAASQPPSGARLAASVGGASGLCACLLVAEGGVVHELGSSVRQMDSMLGSGVLLASVTITASRLLGHALSGVCVRVARRRLCARRRRRRRRRRGLCARGRWARGVAPRRADAVARRRRRPLGALRLDMLARMRRCP